MFSAYFTVVIGLSKFSYEKLKNNSLYKLFSKHNFVMYLFHQQLVYIPIALLNGKVHNSVLIIANIAIALLSSLLISIVISRIPFISNLFGYKQEKKYADTQR